METTTRNINNVDNLTTIDNLTTDRILISDNSMSLKKISLSDLAKTIIEQYQNSTLGDGYRTLQDSLAYIADNAQAHNSIYRGKSLGLGVNGDQWAVISNGTFKNMFIGDYWTIGGINWRIAAFNYWYNTGYPPCTTNHVVIVPDTEILGYGYELNTSASATGGYMHTGFYTGTNADGSSNTSKSECISTIYNAFGASHILQHKTFLSDSIEANTGKITNTGYVDSTIELMSEMMVFGAHIFEKYGNIRIMDKTQLPLFSFAPNFIRNADAWWLRSVASQTTFSIVNDTGEVYSCVPNDKWKCIRPVFAIKA